MKLLRSTLVLLFAISLVLLVSIPLYAQPNDPQTGDPDQPVPITGIEVLLLSGAALGGYRAFRKASEKREDEDQP